MKKTIALISLLVLMLWLVGCNKKTVNINFPFEVGDVETIELYRYVGAPVSAEKKVVDAEETIKDLYDMFEGLTPSWNQSVGQALSALPSCNPHR